MNAQTVNAATKVGTAKAERDHLATLEKIYLRLIRAAGRRAAEAFVAQTALVAAVNPKWVPPTAQLIDAEQLTADAQRKTARPHELILRDVTAADEIGITWDINHPTSQQLLANVASRLESLNAALRLQVSETIQEGYAQGWSVARTAAAIVEKVDEVAPGRAETYARTDLVALSNGGSLMAAQMVGVAAKTWLTAGDDKVRESHAAAEGQTVGLEQPFDIGGEQGMYPGDPDLSDEEAFNCRCLAPGTIVSGAVLTGAMMRAYEGDLWRITTARGRNLAVTGNHPILTRRGWKAAQLLDEGDNLVCASSSDSLTCGPDVDHMPARAEKLFATVALSAGGCERVVKTAVNFHGDIPDREVEIAIPNDPLPIGEHASLGEEFVELALSLAHREMSFDGSLPSLAGIGKTLEVRLPSGTGSPATVSKDQCDRASLDTVLPMEPQHAHSGVEVSDHGFEYEGSLVLLEETSSFTVASSRSGLSNPVVDDHCRESRLVSDLLIRLSGVVELDEVVNVKREWFRGHVYNFATVGRAYIAGGIVTANCTLTYGDDLTAALSNDGGESAVLQPSGGHMETLTLMQDEYDALIAAASGSTSLPLSAQDAKWDAGAARKTLEPGQFAKAHFWRDPAGDPDLIGSYKLPFAAVVDGKLTAIWHGVTAGAARLSHTDIPAADKKAVQAKMGAYYTKAAKQFKDDSIVAPWDDSKASGDAAALSALREIAPGLETLTDDEILGFRSIIFAAMKKHDYRGDGGACAVCGEMASNKDAHYEAKTEKLTVELADIALTAAAGEATAWQATMLVEGVPTEDGRLIANGAVTWRALPLPIGLMLETPHSDIVEAPVCGRIDQIWRAGSLIQASGIFNDNVDDPEMRATGLQAVEAVENRIVKGVSVDLLVLADEVIFVPDENDEGDDSGDGAGGDGMDIIDSGQVQEAPVMVDLPDGRWLYVVTEGVIGSACVVPVPAIAQGQIQVVTADASHVFERVEFVTPLFQEDSLVAAVAPIRPPAGWFEDPKLAEPTPLTITDDGQVYGHVALWSSCHQGFPGRCVPPPRSNTGYSMFHVGAIKTDEGQTLSIGKITLKAPHADVALNSAAARAHYDNTGTVAAFVRAGEDEFGPWVAGALRSDASEEIVRDLLANPLSGDWRGGEMIAAHAVPAPGFPVLRASVVDDSGDEIETALIITSPLATFRPAAKALQAAQEALEAEQERVAPLAYLRPGARKVA